jgi:type IV pilus assembly protein PilM
MNFSRKASQGLVGVDIGSSSIKVVELRQKRSRYELVNLALNNLASDSVTEGAVLDRTYLSSAIKKMFDENNISTTNVATSLSGQSVVMKRMTVQASTEEELDQAIQQEVTHSVQLDLTNFSLNYYVLGSSQEKDSLNWRADRYRGAQEVVVLLLAAHRNTLQTHTELLLQASRTPVVVDIDAFALQNAFELSYEPAPEQVIALLNIGATTMNVNIIRGGLPLFTRDISTGGNKYTDVLQKELDLTVEEAERLKVGIDVGRVQPEAELPHLESVSENLVSEIQAVFDEFYETMQDPIQAVYLAGGTARIRGLPGVLQAKLKLPVDIIDPFRKIHCDPAKFDADFVANLAPRMTVAVGLALRSFDAA